MTGNQKDLVKSHFGQQAAQYAKSKSHARGQDLQMLLDALPLGPGVRVLDAATGTGNTALAMAETGAQVTGMDITPEMMAHGERQAAERGLSSVTFVTGDAEAMPFGDGSFDIVASRRAPHHFPSIPRFLREARRVLRDGGTLGIVDQVSPEQDAAYELMERLEKLRDPSHARALRASEWHRAVVEAGFELNGLLIERERMTVNAWLELAGVNEAQRTAIEDALRAADPAAAGPNRIALEDGVWKFTKQRIVLWATAV